MIAGTIRFFDLFSGIGGCLLQGTSDNQAYKQAGNGVTVNVVEAIGKCLYEVHCLLEKEEMETDSE